VEGKNPDEKTGRRFGIIRGVDVLITPAAQREVEALRILRPGPSTWGFLIGHKRGFRFIVEKVFPTGGLSGPDERALAELERAWPGGIIGLFAVRPGPDLKRVLLGPLFYGKLFINLRPSVKALALRPYVVDFERRFFLEPISFAPAGKAEAHE